VPDAGAAHLIQCVFGFLAWPGYFLYVILRLVVVLPADPAYLVNDIVGLRFIGSLSSQPNLLRVWKKFF